MKAIDIWKKPNRFFWTISVIFVLFMLGLSWLIVYVTGGTKFAYLHLMYIPIILASFSFGVRGGIITAIAGGILLGPLMPLDVENNIGQPIYTYIYRTVFFIIISGIVGYIPMF